MADHLRTQIRKAAVAALTGLATTGDNVFESRDYDLPEDKLPAVLVYTRDEAFEPGTAGPWQTRTQQRELQLVVASRAQAAETALDDLLDRIGLEVDLALMAAAGDPAGGLHPLLTALALAQTARNVDIAGQKATGGDVITYVATYHPREADPSQRGA